MYLQNLLSRRNFKLELACKPAKASRTSMHRVYGININMENHRAPKRLHRQNPSESIRTAAAGSAQMKARPAPDLPEFFRSLFHAVSYAAGMLRTCSDPAGQGIASSKLRTKTRPSNEAAQIPTVAEQDRSIKSRCRTFTEVPCRPSNPYMAAFGFPGFGEGLPPTFCEYIHKTSCCPLLPQDLRSAQGLILLHLVVIVPK